MQTWTTNGKTLTLDRPRVMAILNATPDSFSDGGELTADNAAARAQQAVRDGAEILDIGGESTRPGSERVAPDEQIERVVPVVRAVRAVLPKSIISVDTTRSKVAEAALDAGTDAVNDVSGAVEDPKMLGLCARRGCGLILMHRLTTPDRDRYSTEYERAPEYGDVVGRVRTYLAERAALAEAAGVARESILVDPGLGFGKSVGDNLELVRRTDEIATLGYGVVSGASRKSFVGRVCAAEGEDPGPGDRLAGSIAFSVAHLMSGARVFRVHDVREQARALRAAWRVAGEPG